MSEMRRSIDAATINDIASIQAIFPCGETRAPQERCRHLRIVGVRHHQQANDAAFAPGLDALDLPATLDALQPVEPPVGTEETQRAAGARTVIDTVGGVFRGRGEHEEAVGKQRGVGEAEGNAVERSQVDRLDHGGLQGVERARTRQRIERLGERVADDEVARLSLAAAVEEQQFGRTGHGAFDVERSQLAFQSLVGVREIDGTRRGDHPAPLVERQQGATAPAALRARSECQQRSGRIGMEGRQAQQRLQVGLADLALFRIARQIAVEQAKPVPIPIAFRREHTEMQLVVGHDIQERSRAHQPARGAQRQRAQLGGGDHSQNLNQDFFAAVGGGSATGIVFEPSMKP